jgi:hypothetical protein
MKGDFVSTCASLNSFVPTGEFQLRQARVKVFDSEVVIDGLKWRECFTIIHHSVKRIEADVLQVVELLSQRRPFEVPPIST